jgi:DNA polymerase III epsilon subunit-like protein
LILQIGIKLGEVTFEKFVRPIPIPTYQNLIAKKFMNVDSTCSFWTKLLVRKGLVDKTMLTKTIEEQCGVIDSLVELEPAETVIKEALVFAKESYWIGYNGKSFDQPILQGYFSRMKIKTEPTFLDALPICRQLHLTSHSQEKVFKFLFDATYKAHLALDDAIALDSILIELAKRRNISVLELFKTDKKIKNKMTDETHELLSIKFIGKKTLAILLSNDINTVEKLRNTRSLSLKEFKMVAGNNSTRLYNFLGKPPTLTRSPAIKFW